MIRYNSTLPALEAYVNGAWASLLDSGATSSSTLYLGSSTGATNPQRNGDATTGLYTAGSGLVDVAASNIRVAEFSTSGVNIATGGLNINGGNGVSSAPDYSPGYSIAVGSGALASQVLLGYGLGNTAVGYNSMTANLTGSANVALGNQALSIGTANINSVAIGFAALQHAGSINGNVAVGFLCAQ